MSDFWEVVGTAPVDAIVECQTCRHYLLVKSDRYIPHRACETCKAKVALCICDDERQLTGACCTPYLDYCTRRLLFSQKRTFE